MRRARVETVLAAVAGVLAVVTMVWPAWIEGTVGLEPDAGSGEAEWLLAVGLAVAAVVLGVLGRYHRRVALATAGG